MAGLSKSRLLAHQQCPKRLWLQVNRPDLQVVDPAQQARMDAGNMVGDLARQMYPKGVLIDGDNLTDAIKATEKVLSLPRRIPIFEATFRADEVLVRNDVLAPEPRGYHLIEVKSSTSVKDYHLQDVAVQAYVTEQSGIPLRRVSLMHIDNQFEYPGNGDYQGLFKLADVTADARARLSDVPKWIASAQATLAGSEPIVAPGEQCHDPFDCPFIGHCHPPADPNAFPVEELPYSGKLAPSLRAEGYADIREVPRGRLTSPRHRLMWTALNRGKPVLDKGVRDAMSRLTYPRYYLDFETISFAVPIWAGTRPYQQIPFQWSCHIESHTGSMKHREWLADGSHDPRRDFVESLLSTIGPRGTVLAYNASFERKRLEELADAFPEHEATLLSLMERIVDLLGIARDHYYHPDMRGSWSIKNVLPTIAPELDYGALAVANGGMAQEVYLQLLSPTATEAEKQQWRTDLLTYCQRDTQAMVEVAHYFEGKRR
jgi:hypothetical protein